jgi:methylated-DNA-[protein]-cysteine S-methyltransferase
MNPDLKTLHYLFDTPLGMCAVAWNGRGLVGVQLPERDPGTTERRIVARVRSAGAAAPPDWVQGLIEDIRRYLRGDKVDFSTVAVDLDGVDDLRLRIYAALRQLRFGETTTYGNLARALGVNEWQGARDVGEAMGRNPVPIVIPCHRVLAAGGKIGGFSAPGGAATKRKLLMLEGVCLDSEPPRLPGL